MTCIRFAIAALIASGLAAVPIAAEAKKHRSVRHHATSVPAPGYRSAAPPAAQPRSYGTSGSTVGTVTAPSIGSYYWPSVGVTNAVPTWSNTNPPVR